MNLWKKLFGAKAPPPHSVADVADPKPQRPSAVEDDAAERVHDRRGSAEEFYARMSRDLIARHGALVKAEYVSHFPTFEIRFKYTDGTTVVSGARTGRHDIHFLSLGYVGEGPRYAKAFLEAAGCNRTSQEIEGICPGDVIVPGDSKVGRMAAASKKSAVGSCKVSVSQLGTVSGNVRPSTSLAVSPDERFLAFFTLGEDGTPAVSLVSLPDHKPVWTKDLIPYAAIEKANRYGNNLGAAFISDTRLVVFGRVDDSRSSMLLVNAEDGRMVDEFSLDGAVETYDRTDSWACSKRGMAVVPTSNGPLIVSVQGDRLVAEHTNSTNLTYNCDLAFGVDGCIYLRTNYSTLCRFNPETRKFDSIGDGNHDVCAHEDGLIICGGGYSDGSGDCYMSVHNPTRNLAEVIDFGRDTVFDVMSCGPGRVITCYGPGPSDARKIGLFSVSKRERYWEKPFRKAQYRGHILCVSPRDGWTVMQDAERVSFISLADSSTLWSTPRPARAWMKGVGALKHRQVYLHWYVGDRANDKKVSGVIECLKA